MIYLLPHTIDRAADQCAGSDAFIGPAAQLTFGDVYERANQLAHLLISEGIQRNDRVGVAMPRCLESAVAVYGIMKAGAAYVPIDPYTPVTSAAQLVESCDIRVLIVQNAKSAWLAQLVQLARGLHVVIGVDGDLSAPVRTHSWHELLQYPGQQSPDVRMVESDLAYIIFTSGSTGRPKGIMHTHHSGLSYARISAKTYGVRASDRIANHSPLHFDMSTFGYFTAPFACATTLLIPEAYTKVPASLATLIADREISIWYSVPLALIHMSTRGALERHNWRHLRWVLFGGEPFPPAHLQALRRIWSHARFSNVYGPAEVNQCTYHHLPAMQEDGTQELPLDQPIPLGSVWDNTEAVVLGENDEILGPDNVGELAIRSPTMMRGYWQRGDSEDQVFFRRTDSAGLEQVYYRTGDLVKRDNQNKLVFLGRGDRQVKVRGYRVELDEVELVMSSHPLVEEAAAFLLPDDNDLHRIHAAIVPRPRKAVTAADITSFIAQRLPWYAVPFSIAITTSFPRTTSGKTDRRQLALTLANQQTDSEAANHA